MIGFLIAVISGLLMSVQGVFNTQVTKTTGMWVANAFVQFTAFLICIAIWAISDRTSFGTLLKVEPRYMLIGGILGAGITYTVIKAMDMMGPAKAVMMIVTDFSGVSYRAFRTFRGGKTALFLEKGNRHSAGGRRYYFVQMGVNYPCKNEATPLQ